MLAGSPQFDGFREGLMRVLLISPFFENPRYPLYMPSENLGLGYLASMLREHDVEVKILDANMLEAPAAMIPYEVESEVYDLVGISIPFQSVVDEAIDIAKFVKLHWPNTHITVGGHFPTFRHKEILEADSHIDSVVRGDGEDTLLALVKALACKEELSDVQGLSFRNSSGIVVINTPRPPREDLDSLPYPARDTL